MIEVANPRMVSELACDSHIHVYDRSFPSKFDVPADCGIEAYRKLSVQTGISRVVIVQPRPYWTDNSALLAAIDAFGQNRARGVAVVHPQVDDVELDMLHSAGVRGVRFSLFTPDNAVVGFEMVEPLAHRIRDLGWHIQLHWTAAQIVEHRAIIERLPVPVVFDHMARLPAGSGTAHPAFDLVTGLLKDGRGWVKLSGAYLISEAKEDERYRDVDGIARAFVEAVPSRLVWGSDWPHVSELPNAPATAGLLSLLSTWVDSPTQRDRILKSNPAELYGFV